MIFHAVLIDRGELLSSRTYDTAELRPAVLDTFRAMVAGALLTPDKTYQAEPFSALPNMLLRFTPQADTGAARSSIFFGRHAAVHMLLISGLHPEIEAAAVGVANRALVAEPYRRFGEAGAFDLVDHPERPLAVNVLMPRTRHSMDHPIVQAVLQMHAYLAAAWFEHVKVPTHG